MDTAAVSFCLELPLLEGYRGSFVLATSLTEVLVKQPTLLSRETRRVHEGLGQETDLSDKGHAVLRLVLAITTVSFLLGQAPLPDSFLPQVEFSHQALLSSYHKASLDSLPWGVENSRQVCNSLTLKL